MEKATEINRLEIGRKETDVSLNSEREKATQELISGGLKSQHQTDQIVVDQRGLADKETAQSRAQVDRVQNQNGQRSDTKAKVVLDEERRKTDQATALERNRMDKALTVERNLHNKIATEALSRERSLTDKNLAAERTAADENVTVTSTQLERETTSHKKTKVSLTTRDEFLAIVNHDLRNPIGAARSFAEILLEDPEFSGVSLTSRKYLEAIHRNTSTALRLISDLLDMERLAQKKFDLTIKPANLVRLVQQSIESFTPECREKNLQLIAEVRGVELSAEIDCDQDRVAQILSNLVGNAIKFTPEGGTIKIAAQITGDQVQFSVVDTGPGIPDSKKNEIFERFAQIGLKDRRGLGLGLYISKMLTEAHHGTISVETPPPGGSIFRFILPLRQKAKASPTDKAMN